MHSRFDNVCSLSNERFNGLVERLGHWPAIIDSLADIWTLLSVQLLPSSFYYHPRSVHLFKKIQLSSSIPHSTRLLPSGCWRTLLNFFGKIRRVAVVKEKPSWPKWRIMLHVISASCPTLESNYLPWNSPA